MLASMILGATAIASNAGEPTTVRQQALDSLIADQHIVMMGNARRPSQDSIISLMREFYVDQFRNYQEPAAPYFMFMSHDGNLAMGVGGVVRMRAYFDPGNSQPTSSFNPYNIPMDRTPLNRNHFGTTPSGTAIFMRLIGRSSKIGTYQLYVQAKFNGGSNGREFKLSKSYAVVNDWTVGYATSTFSDGAAAIPTVDANGGTLSMDFTSLLVRWAHDFKKSGITVAASVETPEQNLGVDGVNCAERSNSIPNFAAMAQYQWAEGQHVRVAAITRFLPYRNLNTGRNHTPVGYGLQFSTVFNPCAPLTLYGIVNAGRSYSSSGGDFLLSKYDMIGDPANPGRMCTIPSWSYLVGASYHFSPKFMMGATFGQARNNSSLPRIDDTYRYGLYGAVNAFYYFTPRISMGVEANFGKRQDVDGAHAWGRRIGAMCQFSF